MKYLIGLLLLASCTTPSIMKLPSEPYQTAGTEQFFLPELPTWANGSLSANCARDVSVRYLDHGPIEKLHALDFISRVELQTQFNRKWKQRYSSTTHAITPQEEAVLFLETLELVKSGLKELRFPAQGPLHVVWWDQLKDRARAQSWLMNLANQGNPIVLVSLCTDSDGLDRWIEAQKLGELELFTMGVESAGPFDLESGIKSGVLIPLTAFFPRERTTLWTVGHAPAEFPVGYNVRNVEE
jgi:hypothetical protein